MHSLLASHRHAKVCSTPRPGHAGCNAIVDLNVTGSIAPNSVPFGYGPSGLQAAYNLPSGTAGSGQTVAVVDAYDLPTAEADLATYRTQYGLPACTTANGCFRKVNQDGNASPLPAADPGWGTEIALDLDMVSAACPNCHILLVEANDTSMSGLGTAVNSAAALGANAISNSWGGSEFSNEAQADAAYFSNHPGVAITASAGDSGYGVEYPAASPDVIAVGGTSLFTAANARGYSESVWNGTGSGCSAYETKPTWQTDSGCTGRTVADVSMVADPSTGVAVYDSTPYNLQSGWMVFGGTSAASPLVAASAALAAGPLANLPAATVYTHPGSLFDVTSGSNGTCSPSYFCNATTGYDGPTGLGTLNGVGAFLTGAAPVATAPGAPTAVSATAGNASAVVHWQSPGNDGGSAVTGYVVTPMIAGVPQNPTTFSSTATTQTISGLHNGTGYAFTVAAVNSVATGVASAASAVVTPQDAITARYAQLGGPASILGLPVGSEVVLPAGLSQAYQGGALYWSPTTGAHLVMGTILAKYRLLGAATGPLGFPTTDELGTPDRIGRYNHFVHGSIYWTKLRGAFEVMGSIQAKWAALGWERSTLGYPTTDETGTPDRIGRYNHFVGGSIYWTKALGAHEVLGAIQAKWAALGWERGHLGYPISDQFVVFGGVRSNFQHGYIIRNAVTGVVAYAFTS